MPRKAPPIAESPTMPEAPKAPAKPPVQLDIRINLDRMTVADLPLVHRMRRGEALDNEVVELFDRVVDGGSAAIPYPALGDACRAFYRAVFNAAEPETPQGN